MTSADYSDGEHDHSPLELEASTSPAPRPLEVPSVTVEGLTVAEAASAYGLSISTLRRLLSARKVEGAAKVPGPKGTEYRIPPTGLEKLGYRAKETRAGAVLAAARASLEAEELTRRVSELEATLELERVRREAAEREAQRLSESLDDYRTNLAAALQRIPLQLEAPKKRKLFRRKRTE